MTIGPEERDVVPPEALFRALLSLHAAARKVDPSRIPGFAPMSLREALQVVTDAPLHLVSRSARLDALHELARQGFPGFADYEDAYRALMATVAEGREIDDEDLRRDLLAAQTLQGGFQATPSREALLHHEGAFVGEDVCTTRRVTVGGLEAVWVYSEFETDADFDHVATWLDPRRWSTWGPLFFKRMEIVGSSGPVYLPAPGTEHWHATFLEVVQFPWTELETQLHCDYWRDDDQAAGMTYELSRSLDSQIDVDRGFILVNKVGSSPSATGGLGAGKPLLRVKVLKIVGFTEDLWDLAAEWVCPFWTDFIRAAVEGGTTSVPKAPTHFPDGGGSGWPWRESVDAWAGFLGESARPYLDLMEDVTTRVSSKGIDPARCLDDEKRIWSLLAKDWAKAWNHGLKTVDELSEKGLDASLSPPASSGTTGSGGASAMAAAGPVDAEGTTIPIAGLGANDKPACSDLTSIEAGAATIAARDVVVTVVALQDGGYAARLRATVTPAQPSLYVGHLTLAPGGPVVPVQLYVSRANRK